MRLTQRVSLSFLFLLGFDIIDAILLLSLSPSTFNLILFQISIIMENNTDVRSLKTLVSVNIVFLLVLRIIKNWLQWLEDLFDIYWMKN